MHVDTTFALTLTTLSLAFLVGFAAHRASLCNVRAVVENVGSGQAWMLSSIAKASLWAALVNVCSWPSSRACSPRRCSAEDLRCGEAPRTTIWPAFAGGIVMGLGGAMMRGGNDTLVLTGLPTLSPQALGAYAAMLAGIALAVLAMRATGARLPMVICSGDVCRSP